MYYTLVETPEFSAQRQRLLPDDVYLELQVRLLIDPTVGDVVQGTGGIRKVRVAMRGKGRRGGGRVLYVVRNVSGRIYLLTCFAKAEQSDHSAAERRGLRQLVANLL